MNTHYCEGCVTHWAPFHAIDSACCECGTGLRRSSEPMSDDAPERHRAAMFALIERTRVEEQRRQNRRDWALRDAARLDAETW